MSAQWFPGFTSFIASSYVSDSIQADFDKQAELFRGPFMKYTQLSPGNFKGRLLCVEFDQFMVHIEFCNQTIEAQLKAPHNAYIFCIVLEEAAPFSFGGVPQEKDWVYVVPPDGETTTISPADGTRLFFSLNRNAIAEHEELADEAFEWLTSLEPHGAYVKSRYLADRLRSHVLSALEVAAAAKSDATLAVITQSTIFTIAYSLTMAWLKRDAFSDFQRTATFERYQRARKLLLDRLLQDEIRAFEEDNLSSLGDLGSRRSVELAFSKNVAMGPLAYYRVIRLHRVRRKLMERERLGQNIGDIASEEGFLDWSRFSVNYYRQYGERPSDTRRRLRN
ncbi:MAG: helix-turn-helix domain-containing protein [Pseudomonadota bacterium]